MITLNSLSRKSGAEQPPDIECRTDSCWATATAIALDACDFVVPIDEVFEAVLGHHNRNLDMTASDSWWIALGFGPLQCSDGRPVYFRAATFQIAEADSWLGGNHALRLIRSRRPFLLQAREDVGRRVHVYVVVGIRCTRFGVDVDDGEPFYRLTDVQAYDPYTRDVEWLNMDQLSARSAEFIVVGAFRRSWQTEFGLY